MLVNGVYFCDGCQRSIPSLEAKAWILQYGPMAQLLCVRCQRGEGVAQTRPRYVAADDYNPFDPARRESGPPPRERERERPGRRRRDVYDGRPPQDEYADDDWDEPESRPRRPTIAARVGTGSKMTMGAGLGLVMISFFGIVLGYLMGLESVKQQRAEIHRKCQELDEQGRKSVVPQDKAELKKQGDALSKQAADLQAGQRGYAATRPLTLIGAGGLLLGAILIVAGSMGGGRGRALPRRARRTD